MLPRTAMAELNVLAVNGIGITCPSGLDLQEIWWVDLHWDTLEYTPNLHCFSEQESAGNWLVSHAYTL